MISPAARYWWDDAACRDTDPGLWHIAGRWDGHDNAAQIAEARAICATCPVARDCLMDALADPNERNDWAGIRAGSTPADRRALLRRKKKVP